MEAEIVAAAISSDSELGPDVPGTASASTTEVSLTQVMTLLSLFIKGMLENIAADVKKDDIVFNHLDNVKLDIRNFVRTKTLTNKHDAWRKWKNQSH